MEYGNRLFGFGAPKVIAGLLITFFLMIYAFKIRRTNKLVFFSICWFFASLLPVSHIYPLNAYMAEHWLYLPSIGFFFVLAKGLNCLYEAKRFKISAIIFIVASLFFYSYLTIKRNDDWREPIVFYKRTLEYAPHSVKMHHNLGNAYRAIDEHEEAIASYGKALEIDSNYAAAHFNLGNAYYDLLRYEEAIASYKKAIEIDRDYSKAYNNLGNLYDDIGKKDEAIAMYKKAIETDSNNVEAQYNLGNEYRRIGRNKEAIQLYKKAIAIDPHDAVTHNNLAVVYYHEGQYDLAIAHCDRAIELRFQVHPEFLEVLEAYR